MKKTLLILLVTGYGYFASAQSLDLGLRGGAASTWLMNSNVFNAGSDQDVVSSISPEFGFHSEFNFLGGTGVELEVIYSKYTQKYKGAFIDAGGLYQNTTGLIPTNIYINGESFTASTQLTMIKIPLLFHYEAKGGFSLEVGPEYCMINDATYSATYSNGLPSSPSSVSYSTKGSFGSSSLNAVLGFGWNIKLTPAGNWCLLADLRFEYGLNDIRGTDGHGEDLNNASTNPVYVSYSGGTPRYSSYKSTNLLEGSFSVGVFYRIGLLKGAKSLL